MVKKRDILNSVVLTVLTFGIYGIYWYIVLTDDIKYLSKNKSLRSGGTSFLLSLITFGIYGFFWNYNIGKALSQYYEEQTGKDRDYSMLFLVLSILRLSIIVSVLTQDKINDLANN